MGWRVAMGLALAALSCTVCLPTIASAEEPTWWEQCEELPDEQIEECFYEHNGQVPPSERHPTAPTAPIRNYINHRYSGAHSIFLNCPGNNRLGDYGLACEFRFLRYGFIIKGNASVEAEGEDWSHTAWWLLGFHAQAPAKRHWMRCGIRHHHWESAEPVRLAVRGTDCIEGRATAYRIANLDVSTSTLRLPHHFKEGEWQAFTLGFVVSRYDCHGRVQVREGSPNPYGHETAKCRTRFGDRITYVFDQGS